MVEHAQGLGEKVRNFVERVKFGAKEDPVFGALGPFLGIKFSTQQDIQAEPEPLGNLDLSGDPPVRD